MTDNVVSTSRDDDSVVPLDVTLKRRMSALSYVVIRPDLCYFVETPYRVKAVISANSPQAVRNLIQQHLLAVCAKRICTCANLKLSACRITITRYTKHHICPETPSSSTFYMHANRETAHAVASQAYNKLQPWASASFSLLEAHEKTFVIDDDKVIEMASIDGATRAPLTLLTTPTFLNSQSYTKSEPSP